MQFHLLNTNQNGFLSLFYLLIPSPHLLLTTKRYRQGSHTRPIAPKSLNNPSKIFVDRVTLRKGSPGGETFNGEDSGASKNDYFIHLVTFMTCGTKGKKKAREQPPETHFLGWHHRKAVLPVLFRQRFCGK